jgi:hypothetical protein
MRFASKNYHSVAQFVERARDICVSVLKGRRAQNQCSKERRLGALRLSSFYIRCSERRKAGPVMRNLVLYVLMLFLFAASVASATTILSRPSPNGDDFCFGYAICE